MGRDGSLSNSLSRIHPNSRTPRTATVLVGIVPLLLFFGAMFIGSVSAILTDAINAVGLQIAVYYSLAGFAVVFSYRRSLFHSAKLFFLAGLWPLAGAIFMVAMFAVTLPNLNPTTQIVGIGALAAGLIPAAFYWQRQILRSSGPTMESDGITELQ